MTQAALAAGSAKRGGRDALTGSRIRERRTVLGIRQADLARLVEISPSYLNLIEHNRRRIGGKLLVNIANALSVEVGTLTHGAEAELMDQLSEAAIALPDARAELARADEFVGRFPGWARLIAEQSKQIAGLQNKFDALADRLTHDPVLSDVLHDLLSKVTAIQSTSAILAETTDLDREWQEKFILNLAGDSQDLAERSAALVGYLDGSGETELTLATPVEELEAHLGRSGFHLAALEDQAADVASCLKAAAPDLASPAAKDLAERFYRRYREDAARIPLRDLQELVAEAGCDPVRVAETFAVDLSRAMRRLASLPPVSGLPSIGLVICDGSGALTLRKPAGGFMIPRFGASCGLWPLFRALGQPGHPVRSWVTQPGTPDEPCLAYALCNAVLPIVFDGRQPVEATMLLVPQARLLLQAAPPDQVLELGATCRTCPIEACPARREVSVLPGGF